MSTITRNEALAASQWPQPIYKHREDEVVSSTTSDSPTEPSYSTSGCSFDSERSNSNSESLDDPHYLALYDYTPSKEDELELNEGELYTVSEKCPDGWFKGTSLQTGLSGVFPGNFVQIANYLALYDYTPSKEDELELREGELYTVSEKCPDGWFKGTSLRTGLNGVFPGNFVQIANTVDSTPIDLSVERSSAHEASDILIVNRIDPSREETLADTSSSSNRKIKKSSRIECAICMEEPEEITASEKCVVATVCGHIFCSLCLEKALEYSKQCATCRKQLNKKQYHPLYV